MGKLRSDSTWRKLSRTQREELGEWLFEENLGYQEALERVQQRWGIISSKTSLTRFARRLREERLLRDLLESQGSAEALGKSEARLESLRGASLLLIGKRLLDNAMSDGEVKELTALGRLMSDSEQREIQRERLALEREKFEFNAAAAALAELPHVHSETAKDIEREKARIQAIKVRLFGLKPAEADRESMVNSA
jgi:hypothetical protein